MIEADDFLAAAKQVGYDFFTGTPCSYLKPLINRVIDDDGVAFVPAVNEGDAVAIAAGAWLGGRRSVVMFQNSGLGNAVNPITSLSQTFKIPFLGIVTWRGEPRGAVDEPQHELMGAITTDLLELMRVPWMPFPNEPHRLKQALAQAGEVMETQQAPFFFVMKKGDVAPYELNDSLETGRICSVHPAEGAVHNGGSPFGHPPYTAVTRTEALQAIKGSLDKKSCIVATTGKTGRELFEIGDEARQFYMVGSMGCALSIGLGLALTRSSQPVCVVDGDGALMMRMGAMATVGRLAPSNLIHVVLDNCVHDSTGGQQTGSEALGFCGVAQAAGYRKIFSTDDPQALGRFIEEAQSGRQLAFVHFSIRPGSPKKLGRPTVEPPQVARRVRAFLSEQQP
jgi:phosphonopyruvate decarboxylase